MAWKVTGNDLTMAVGDYGIELPFTFLDITFSANDEVKMSIKRVIGGEALVEKSFQNIQESTVNVVLTYSETEKLPVGSYVYSLDWYQDGFFMCNLIDKAKFRVVSKA